MIYLKNTVNLKYQIGVVICWIFLLSSSVFAWTGKGHSVAAKWTYQQLTYPQQAYYASLAKLLDPNSNNSNSGSFAFLSHFPDVIRNDVLEELFVKFDSTVPDGLLAYKNLNTSAWHYHNNVVNSYICEFENRGRLLFALNSLDQTLKEKLTKIQEAIVLSLQMHFIQDAHQPLHTFTQLDSNCRSDRGGNKRCIDHRSDGSCEQNLHQLWDRGFDVFDMKKSSVFDDVPQQNTKVFSFDPKAWTNESIEYYEKVYHLETLNYFSNAQKVVKAQTRRSVSRLHDYLDQHFEYKMAAQND